MSTASKIGIGLTGVIVLLVIGLELYSGSGSYRVESMLDNHKREWARCENLFEQAHTNTVLSLKALEAGSIEEAMAEFKENKISTESWFECDYAFKNKFEQEVKAAGLADAYTDQVWAKWLNQNEKSAQQAGRKSSPGEESIDVQRIESKYSGPSLIAAQFIMGETNGLMALRDFQRLNKQGSRPEGLSQP